MPGALLRLEVVLIIVLQQRNEFFDLACEILLREQLFISQGEPCSFPTYRYGTGFPTVFPTYSRDRLYCDIGKRVHPNSDKAHRTIVPIDLVVNHRYQGRKLPSFRVRDKLRSGMSSGSQNRIRARIDRYGLNIYECVFINHSKVFPDYFGACPR